MHKIFLFCLMIFIACHASSETLSTVIRDPFVSITTSIAQSHNVVMKLKSCFIPLYFSKAADMVSFIEKPEFHILSSQGKIHADTQTNQIWLRDDAKHIARVRAMVQHLDQSGPQFLIKAKIINLDRQYQQSLGVLFQSNDPNHSSITTLKMNEPETHSGVGEFSIGIAKLSGNHLLDLQISALEQEGHAILISNPALMTLNHLPALIQSGAEIPYQESTSSGATSVSFKKAVLQLKVTPQAMPKHRILLHISLNQDTVSTLTVNGVPAIQTQQITTQVIVNNRQTIVLGGILEMAQAKQSTGIPIINNIPIIGQILRHRMHKIKQQELLIFITPEMIKVAE